MSWLATLLLVLAAPAWAHGSASGDLWQRFCNEVRFQVRDSAAVAREARALSRSQTHYFDLMVRAEPWMWHLVEAVTARGLPMDLAALPAVESGFSVQARSPRDAGGLWQMLPSTARSLGLRVDADYDSRADVTEATRAALDYLQYLHDRFGDWSLALAAYNGGEARVARAIAAANRRDDATGRAGLRLPEETERHYLRLLAFIRVSCAPERYGLRRPRLPDRPLNRVVYFDRDVPIAEIAALARVPVAELRRLNPAIAPASSVPTQRLRLPAHRLAPLERALEARPDLALARYASHRVAAGDTLSGLARRYRTTTDTLVRVNGLKDTRIRVGEVLRVPLKRSDG